ncbi:MAG: transporter substrate-binding domain-containing protein [Azospirillaceae bacterium]|nr:transporter substrate-binding domain-containing protein [Azospirillaceae bacterium]
MGTFHETAFVTIGLIFSLSGPGLAADKTVRLTSLDWPPYTMEAAPHGATEAVARRAFAAMGYTLETDFLPWQRAMAEGKTDKKYVGYYPEYLSDALTDCLFSAPMGDSPLGLVERRDANLMGKTLDDLKTVVIGTVAGYVNDADFDARVRDGRLKVEEAADDITNLRKVAHGRIPAAVIDANVMSYLIAADADLSGRRDTLVFDGTSLENKTLHVCFRKDEDGRKMAEMFNEGLKKIDVKSIVEAALNDHLK